MKREQHNKEVTFAYWRQSAAGWIITIIIFGIFIIPIIAIIFIIPIIAIIDIIANIAIINISDVINITGNVYT